jgi:hypothetical protein
VRYLHGANAMLATVDAPLHRHLTTMGLEAVQWSWLPLRTLWTEVLSRRDWLRLFDHLLCYPPSHFLLATVSFPIIMRNQLMSLQTREEGLAFFHNVSGIDITKWMAKTKQLALVARQRDGQQQQQAASQLSGWDAFNQCNQITQQHIGRRSFHVLM